MLNYALVGCGGMAHAHAAQLQKISEVKVVALVDPITERTAAFREKYFDDAREYVSMDEMLAAKTKLDAVVMVEKPMVTSSAHAYDLWRVVKKSGKLLAIAFQSSYTPEFEYLAAERERGTFGKVQVISGWLSQSWLNGTKNSWRQEPEISGGGQMYDSGAHLFNALMWLMNEPVVEVACFYDKCGSPVDINGVAIARFQHGALASIAIGGNCPPFRTELQIQTDSHLIITDQYGGKLEISGRDGKRVYPHVRQNFEPNTQHGTPHYNFVRALQGKETLKAPVRYGVLLSALMDAMYESADQQKPVSVRAVPKDI
jgi:predicted dehydrogenase